MLTPSTLSTAIDRLYARQLRDNFFLGTPFLAMLSENEDPVPGGRTIVEEISYTNSPNAGNWGGGVSQLTAAFINMATEATFAPTFYYFSVAVPETDEIQNSEPAEILNIVEAQTELAEMSLRDTMGSDVFGDGSARGGFPTLAGLKAAITFGTDSVSGGYGGITRIGASGSRFSFTGETAFWNSNSVAINANTTVTRWKGSQVFGSSTVLDISSMQKVFGFCTLNNMAPDLMIASMLTYNAYYNLLLNIMRQVSEDDLGKQGFTGLMFNNCPLVQDDACDSDTIYYVNTRFLKMRPYSKGNFKMTGWRQPADQLVNIKYGIWMGNMTCNRPNMLGRLTGITG